VYKNPYLLLFVGLLIVTVPAGAQIQKSRPGEQVERHLPVDQTFHEWSLDSQQADNVKRMKVCRVDDLCVMRFRDDEGPRTRVRNLVAPLRHDDDAPISESFANQVQRALGNLRDKPGLRIRFIGHTDDAPLTARDEMVYGDRVSLSKAWAYRIALAMQEKFGLPESAIESDGRGAAQPVAPVAYPIMDARNVAGPSGTPLIEYLPSAPLSVPRVVPTTDTEAPVRGAPVVESSTRP
jgi:outer membrane protein OmpA-like peptidoglycan-associated protein